MKTFENYYNKRFQQHSIGYQYEAGLLTRMDSEHMHEQVTAPAIQLLHSEGFESPSQEFMGAHKLCRQGSYDLAIGEASNALESTIKTILDKREITYEKKWPAKKLIQHFFKSGIVPSYLESSFTNLQNILQSAPTVRNRESAHGDGSTTNKVSQYFAESALNAAAVRIHSFVFSLSLWRNTAG